MLALSLAELWSIIKGQRFTMKVDCSVRVDRHNRGVTACRVSFRGMFVLRPASVVCHSLPALPTVALRFPVLTTNFRS